MKFIRLIFLFFIVFPGLLYGAVDTTYTNHNLGELSQVNPINFLTGPLGNKDDTIDHSFYFTVEMSLINSAAGQGDIVSKITGNGSDITNLVWSILDSENNEIASGVGGENFVIDPLAEETYFINVEGKIAKKNGKYNIDIQVVPLPPTVLLLLTSLAGIGLVARRKN